MSRCIHCGAFAELMYENTKLPVCIACSLRKWAHMVRQCSDYVGQYDRYFVPITEKAKSAEAVQNYQKQIKEIFVSLRDIQKRS